MGIREFYDDLSLKGDCRKNETFGWILKLCDRNNRCGRLKHKKNGKKWRKHCLHAIYTAALLEVTDITVI